VELIQLEQLCLENNTGGTFNVTGFKYRYNWSICYWWNIYRWNNNI
jgi:hypothetical protein